MGIKKSSKSWNKRFDERNELSTGLDKKNYEGELKEAELKAK